MLRITAHTATSMNTQFRPLQGINVKLLQNKSVRLAILFFFKSEYFSFARQLFLVTGEFRYTAIRPPPENPGYGPVIVHLLY